MRYQLIPNGNSGYPPTFDIIDVTRAGLNNDVATVKGVAMARIVVDALNAWEANAAKVAQPLTV